MTTQRVGVDLDKYKQLRPPDVSHHGAVTPLMTLEVLLDVHELKDFGPGCRYYLMRGVISHGARESSVYRVDSQPPKYPEPKLSGLSGVL